MCLALPGRLLSLTEEGGLKMGRIDYDGTVKTACLECLPDARPGQYVLVHAGFAIGLVDEAEARKTLALWAEWAEAEAPEEPGGGCEPA